MDQPHAPAPGIPVYVDTSAPIITEYGLLPMFIEFGPGMRMALAANQRHQFFLPAGYYRISCYAWFILLKVGKAETVVDTRAGVPVHLEYAAPHMIWFRGSVGPPPQKRPDRGLFRTLVVAAAALFGGLGLALLYIFLGR